MLAWVANRATSLANRIPSAHSPLISRSFALKRQAKKADELDFGWEALVKQYTSIPVEIPNLKSIEVGNPCVMCTAQIFFVLTIESAELADATWALHRWTGRYSKVCEVFYLAASLPEP